MPDESKLPESKTEGTPKKRLNTWIKFSNIGLQMAVIIAGLTYLGLWLDEKYPNPYSVFTICLSLFGVFASLYNVFRQVRNMNKSEEEKK